MLRHQYTQWSLPAAEFEGIWESLIYEDEGADEVGAHASEAAQTISEPPSASASANPKRARESQPPSLPTSAARGPDDSLSGSSLKPTLLRYAQSALHFSDVGVDGSLIAWNHVVLLHGPPGTGKTSLCKALAQKLAIRLGGRYPSAQLIEINAHSLFSRWFSESGKLVHRLFAHISELVADEDSLIVLLIDEVESLTSARKAAVSGSEPSDAVRVVNAVLTAIDAFRSRKNVLLLTTSNVSEAIDVAFLDRADIKAFIGPPARSARYAILVSCVLELVRVGLVCLVASSIDEVEIAASYEGAVEGKARLASAEEVVELMQSRAESSTTMSLLIDKDASLLLWRAAGAAQGFSGRTLRKLPLQAHAMYVHSRSEKARETALSASQFARALIRAVSAERSARSHIGK